MLGACQNFLMLRILHLSNGIILYNNIKYLRTFNNWNKNNSPKYKDRQAFANSVAPDQMLQNIISDQGLHCLSYIQQYFRHLNGYPASILYKSIAGRYRPVSHPDNGPL